MLSGVIFGTLVLLLVMGGLMLLFQIPRCPQCRTPLQSMGETTRSLGPYGVETIVDYACADCDEITRHRYICTHIL